MDLSITYLALVNFCDIGYEVVVDKNTFTIINYSNKFIVFKGNNKDNVYKINFSELSDKKVVCLL